MTKTTKTTYDVSNISSGHSLGEYEAETPEEAILMALRDGGWDEDEGISPNLVAVECDEDE